MSYQKVISKSVGLICTRVWIAFAVLVLSTHAALMMGQSATGSITGHVTDQTNAVIPGATVALVDRATNQQRSLTTNGQGYYSLLLLPPANYSLTVKATGFSQFVQENIHLDVGLALKLDATLNLGQTTESVLVTDAPPAIETETSSLGQVIDNQQITDLYERQEQLQFRRSCSWCARASRLHAHGIR